MLLVCPGGADFVIKFNDNATDHCAIANIVCCNAQGMQGTAIAMNVETVARLGAQAVN